MGVSMRGLGIMTATSERTDGLYYARIGARDEKFREEGVYPKGAERGRVRINVTA
jgi:hypothetical protein